MTSTPLQARLASLSTAHKQTISLIHRLENLPTALGQGDDARLELSAEIHLRLKEIGDEMELLRVEMEQLETSGNRRRENSAKEMERQRTEVAMRKLEEDVKRCDIHTLLFCSLLLFPWTIFFHPRCTWTDFDTGDSARGQFRKAQLQAKRKAEASKRQERQLLFSGLTEGDGRPRKGLEKLTHDDLVANASSDVTAALRRTHQLMQAELSRSQFAQETLGLSSCEANPLRRTVELARVGC
jgi:hypothetical protein